MGFYWLWLKRVFFSSQIIFQLSSLFSLLALILAVAVLTVAIMTINGFSSGLEKALTDRQGHIRLQTKNDISQDRLLKDISIYKDFISQQAFFASFEALIVKEQSFKGVFFEAIQRKKPGSFSFLEKRVLKGEVRQEGPFIIVGSALAKELNLSVGSEVLALVSQWDDSYFFRQKAHFKVSAIADFGRHDFNSRVVFSTLSAVHTLGKDKLSGVNLWLKRKGQTDLLARKMRQSLGEAYLIRTWKELDKNFLKIIESDKKIIFFVLFILIVSAGFNVSSSLFVQVFRKTKEISILQAMGARKRLIRNLFLLNGLILGALGTAMGIALGIGFCFLLAWAQNKWHFIPMEIYQVNEIAPDWKSFDLLLIFFISLTVVVLSSVVPAKKACRLNIQTGLSHD